MRLGECHDGSLVSDLSVSFGSLLDEIKQCQQEQDCNSKDMALTSTLDCLLMLDTSCLSFLIELKLTSLDLDDLCLNVAHCRSLC